MSTRALYTFTDETASWNVYKHHDGYPSGAADTITAALEWFAWTLPRFEADEFACAFVTAGKAHAMIDVAEGRTDVDTFREHDKRYGQYSHGGGVRMMPQGDPREVASINCADIQYRYEVTTRRGKLHVTCYEVNAWDTYSEKRLFAGTLAVFVKKFKSA